MPFKIRVLSEHDDKVFVFNFLCGRFYIYSDSNTKVIGFESCNNRSPHFQMFLYPDVSCLIITQS